MPIKYKIEPLDTLKTAGYTTYQIRKEKMLNESTLQKFRENRVDITIKSLETLCKLLNCQPGDILEYVPDDSQE